VQRKEAIVASVGCVRGRNGKAERRVVGSSNAGTRRVGFRWLVVPRKLMFGAKDTVKVISSREKADISLLFSSMVLISSSDLFIYPRSLHRHQHKAVAIPAYIGPSTKLLSDDDEGLYTP
jgi:hypothetical protein